MLFWRKKKEKITKELNEGCNLSDCFDAPEKSTKIPMRFYVRMDY